MPEPDVEIAPGTCPRCGAETVSQAQTDCRPIDDDCPGVEFDPTPGGRLQFVTQEYLVKLDAYYDKLYKGSEIGRENRKMSQWHD